MSTQSRPDFPSSQNKYLAVIFLSYALFAFIFGYAYRFAMNPDGTSVLRLAGYLADGHLKQSVSSGYSPLFTWTVSLFMFFGFEALTAARTAVASCGAGLVFSCWLLSRRFELKGHIRFIAVLTATPLAAFWTIQFISPDVLFAALLLCYFYLVTDRDILKKPKLAFICGITAGFSYLAHHYAMPFFLANFPVVLLSRAYMDKESEPLKSSLKAWLVGIAGFLMIASIWVGVVSVKYGELSVSPKGGIAHAIMGPDDKDRRHPFFVGGLFQPRDPYQIHVFEDISDVKFETWSPFESMKYFIHQLSIIKINVVSILDHFVTKSPFFTKSFVLLILLLIPAAVWLQPSNKRNRFLYAWFIITFSIYSSGFVLLIARSPRRFYALMILFLLLSFHAVQKLISVMNDKWNAKKIKAITSFLIVLVCAAFLIKPARNAIESVTHMTSADQANPYMEMAEQISAVDFPAPYAIIRSSQKPTTDYYMTYFLNKKLLGRPYAKDVDGVTEELRAAGGKSLLVFDHPETVEKLKSDDRFSHMGAVSLRGLKGYDSAVKWVVTEHEITSGWDDEVNIFILK